jgi:iron(III) transport system permease protein
MGRRLTLGAAAAVVAFLGLAPLLVMLARSVTSEVGLSGEFYREIFCAPGTWHLLARSVGLACTTALVSTALGVPLGILFGRTTLPMRRVFPFLFTVPMVLPPYIMALSWWSLLGSRLEGLWGCVLVLGTSFMPIVMFLTMVHVRGVPPVLEEAARLTSSWPRVLFRVTIPSTLPSLVFGPILVFLLALGEFGVPMLLRFDVFAVEGFTQFSAFHKEGAGTAAAVPLAAVTLLILALEGVFLARESRSDPSSTRRRSLDIDLGRWSSGLGVAVGVLCVAVVLLPLFTLGQKSFAPGAYGEAWVRSSDSLVRSLLYAGLGATLLTGVGLLLGYGIQTRHAPLPRSLDTLLLVLFAIPSTVLGIGLVTLWNRPGLSFVYATPAILLVGYVVQFAALPARITAATLSRIPPSMEEAAQVAGSGWMRRMTFIVAPLAARGIVASWIAGFLFCLRDLGVSMLVYPPGRDTFPVRTFTLMANGKPEMIAALCGILIAVTIVPLAMLGLFLARKPVA